MRCSLRDGDAARTRRGPRCYGRRRDTRPSSPTLLTSGVLGAVLALALLPGATWFTLGRGRLLDEALEDGRRLRAPRLKPHDAVSGLVGLLLLRGDDVAA